MIDIKFIRENPDAAKQAAAAKRLPVDVDAFLELDTRRRELETSVNMLRNEQKRAGERIAKASAEERAELTENMGVLKDRIRQIDGELAQLGEQIDDAMLLMPAIPDADVPPGTSDDDNVEVRTWGEPKRKADYGFEFRDHVDLGERLGLFDLERGVKVAGSRNYVLTGAGAQLHEAVMRLAWDIMVGKGFTPLSVPVLVNEQIMYGTGFFPMHRDEVYLAERDAQALVGTSEVPVTGLHSDEILDADALPKLYFARSTCFRREAGAAGRDTRGLYRVHFFDKIEQVVLCKADKAESAKWHEQILANAEELLQALELPHRVVEVCIGEMGQGKVRMYDIETWMPSREQFSETHSASKFHDFQSRRLNIRYRGDDGKPVFVHTLNNTVAASPRLLIPLIEMNQQADGSIRVPERLRGYMGGVEVIGV